MRKEILIMWILLCLSLSQVPMAFAGQCDPPGTVYREGCPREVLDSSTCESCDIDGPNASPDHVCSVTKTERKSIIWSDHTDHVDLGFVFNGQFGAVYCSSALVQNYALSAQDFSCYTSQRVLEVWL